MSRFLSALNEAAAARHSIRLFLACDLDFASGHYRAHDGIGDFSWGGNTFEGIGDFGDVEIPDESIEVIARPLKLKLSGVPENSLPAQHVATALDEVYQGRPATVYLGLVDNDTNQIIDDSEVQWDGRMATMDIRLADKVGEVDLYCESRLRDAPPIARNTDEDQQLAYSGDRFFDLLPKIAGYVGKWGQKEVFNPRNPFGGRSVQSPFDPQNPWRR